MDRLKYLSYRWKIDSRDATGGGSVFFKGSDPLSDPLSGVAGGYGDSNITGSSQRDFLEDDTYNLIDFGDLVEEFHPAEVEDGVFYDAYTDEHQLMTNAAWARLNVYGNDVLNGGGGNDIIFSNLGDDVLRGGDGSDFLIAGRPQSQAVIDWIAAGPGRSSKDELYGGNGNDTLVSHADDNYLQGDAGDDTLMGGANNDTLIGGTGNDLLGGDLRLSQALMVAGVDGGSATLRANPLFTTETVFYGDDLLDGGLGDDKLIGGGGNDVLLGGEGNEWLTCYSGNIKKLKPQLLAA